MRIMDDPELLDQYMDAGTEAMLSRAEEVAVETVAHEEKTVAAERIFEKLADKFLSHMMGLLLKAQNVPEMNGEEMPPVIEIVEEGSEE